MSNRTVNINVHHVTRIEGHGNIVLNATNGKIEKLEWQVPEAPRFFEAMVRGRSYEDIQIIVSRICGICSISHSLAATKAVENAMGIQVSEQTDKIRLLMHYSEQLQSHVLHVGYLVAPDLFGVPSVVPLVAAAPGPVKTIIGLHRLANEWSDLLGRPDHAPRDAAPGWHDEDPHRDTASRAAGPAQEVPARPQGRGRGCAFRGGQSPEVRAPDRVRVAQGHQDAPTTRSTMARSPRRTATAPWRSMTGRRWPTNT